MEEVVKKVKKLKMRGDFVTNSSSVSYVLTMKEDMLNILIEIGGNSNYGSFLKFLRDKIKEEGNKTSLDGEEIYSLKVTFNTAEAFPLDGMDYDGSDFEKSLDVLNKLDFESLTDDELLSFFYWTILAPNHIPYVGATRVDTY